MPTTNENTKNKGAVNRSFFQRLRHNSQGNTLAMVAAGLVPLAGIIGGGVDISRAYMVKTRLQQACDAGVLAGRRAMGEGSYDSNAQAQTNKFFNANFPLDYLKTKNRTFIPSNPGGGSTVTGKASVTLPTVIMKVFGADGIDVAVKCRAILEIANSDITMVLDSTGSMGWDIDFGDGSGTTTRIAALRTAMKSFYSIVDGAAEGSASRIRYAMVPYNEAVNMGEELLAQNPAYLQGTTFGDTFGYQSRRAWYIVYDKIESAGDVSSRPDEQIQYQGNGDCNDYSNNTNARTFTGVYQDNGVWYGSGMYTWQPSSAGYSSGEPANRSDDSNGSYTFSRKSYSGADQFRCTRSVTRTAKEDVFASTGRYTLDSTEPDAVFSHYEHMKIEQPIYDYVRTIEKNSDGSFKYSAAATPTSRTGGTSRWKGCLLEPQTIAADNIAYNGSAGKILPAGATDLDIDKVPNSKDTRWKPLWPEVTYWRDTDAPKDYTDDRSFTGYSCPQPSRTLRTYEQADFNAYVASLTAGGNTYHDIGLLWGARISSNSGIFADNVNEIPGNSGYVSRHLIFMTDGELVTNRDRNTAQGIERLEKRIGNGNSTKQYDNHRKRMLAICAATRAKGIRVWVIAFATDLSDDLIACASPNSAFTANDANALNETFTTIAQTVADLRLSQ